LRTIAGGGEQLGDRGRATGAGLCGPNDVARDQAGNIYISDGGAYCSGPGGNTVRKIDGDGVITTIAGTGKPGFSGDGGPATSARLNLPIAVATDGKGNVYISDEENCRVRKVNRRGVIATIAGTGRAGHSGDGGPATSARLTDPGGLALDERGNLYLADYVAIRRIDPAGRITTVAGTGKAGFSGDGGPATEAQLTAYDVAVDREGKIYISDTDHDRVRMVDRNGIITTVAGSGRAASKLGNGVSATSAALIDRSASRSIGLGTCSSVSTMRVGSGGSSRTARSPPSRARGPPASPQRKARPPPFSSRNRGDCSSTIRGLFTSPTRLTVAFERSGWRTHEIRR
jgi:hypothetical protein